MFWRAMRRHPGDDHYLEGLLLNGLHQGTSSAGWQKPNSLVTEYFANFAPHSDELSSNPLRVEDGYIQQPMAPGLGLDLDEEAMAQHPYRRFPRRRLQQYYDGGASRQASPTPWRRPSGAAREATPPEAPCAPLVRPYSPFPEVLKGVCSRPHSLG